VTPDLDQFAAKGMGFDQFYSMALNCSPARIGLLTGRYPAAAGFRGVIRGGTFARGVTADAPMLSEILSQ
jgi:arylsulfatase A